MLESGAVLAGRGASLERGDLSMSTARPCKLAAPYKSDIAQRRECDAPRPYAVPGYVLSTRATAACMGAGGDGEVVEASGSDSDEGELSVRVG